MATKKNNESISIPIDEIKLEQIDTAVYNWFNTKHQMVVNSRKVPVIFGAWERFAQIQGSKNDNKINSIRDKNGKVKLPLISIRRNDISPNENRYRKIDTAGEPAIEFHREIATSKFDKDRRVPFTSKWKVDDKWAKSEPVYEVHRLPFPSFVNVPYEITFWASFARHINHFHNNIWNDYRMDDIEYNGFFFYSYFDSSSDQSNLEDFSTEERMFKHIFILNIEGYLIEKDEVRINRTPSKIVIAETIIYAPALGPNFSEIITEEPEQKG